MANEFTVAGSQIDGARDYQEDAFLITQLKDANGLPATLVIIADGMGGHAAGNVASNMVVQAFNSYVSSHYPSTNPSEILNECVLKANKSIFETVNETPALSGMGCTLVAAIIESGNIWWASVGDSHLYLIRDNERTKINADHSYGGFLDRMEAAGTPMEPEPGLSRNMLMSAVTGDEINEIDVSEAPLQLKKGDRIVLCSDGMDTLSEGKFLQFSDMNEDTRSCTDALLKAVNDAGMPKQDNTTVIVVDIGEHIDAPEAAPSYTPPAADEETNEERRRKEKLELLSITQDMVLETEPKEGRELNLEVRSSAPSKPKQDFRFPEFKFPAIDISKIKIPKIALPKLKLPWKKIGHWAKQAVTIVLIIAISVFIVMEFGDDIRSLTERIPVPTITIEMPDDGTTPPPTVASGEEEVTEPEEVIEEEEEPEVVAEESEATPVDPYLAVNSRGTLPGTEFSDSLGGGARGPTMVVIPAGSFDMGSSGSSGNTDERPRHPVEVGKFAISKYEITFQEYIRFASATGRSRPNSQGLDRASYPVFNISWDDANEYARWLSRQTGQRYNLPTESQWEYAAGTGTRAFYWWGYDDEPGRAHCFGCSPGLDPRTPTRIGSYEPNKFGIYDTAGNVAEWVRDCWHENYNDAPGHDGVWEGGDCSARVVRGGSYSTPFLSIRHANRDKYDASGRYDNIGFRVVREVQ